MFLAILVCGNYVAVATQDKANAVSDVDKARVFITDSQSWEMAGGGVGSSAGFGGAVHGGARPQTAEIIKTFGERCPETAVNNKQEKADYIVVLDHEGGKGLARDKQSKMRVLRFPRIGRSEAANRERLQPQRRLPPTQTRNPQATR